MRLRDAGQVVVPSRRQVEHPARHRPADVETIALALFECSASAASPRNRRHRRRQIESIPVVAVIRSEQLRQLLPPHAARFSGLQISDKWSVQTSPLPSQRKTLPLIGVRSRYQGAMPIKLRSYDDRCSERFIVRKRPAREAAVPRFVSVSSVSAAATVVLPPGRQPVPRTKWHSPRARSTAGSSATQFIQRCDYLNVHVDRRL